MQVSDSTNLQKVRLNLAFKGVPFWNAHGAQTALTSGSLSSTWTLCLVKSLQSPRLSILLHSSWKYYYKIHSWELGVFPWPMFPGGIGFSTSLWVPQGVSQYYKLTSLSHSCPLCVPRDPAKWALFPSPSGIFLTSTKTHFWHQAGTQWNPKHSKPCFPLVFCLRSEVRVLEIHRKHVISFLEDNPSAV